MGAFIWTPGKNHHIVDALSRAPVFGPCEMTFEPEQLEHCLRIFDPSLTQMDPTLDEAYNETLQLVRAGKNATHIQKSSKAYAYRRIIDLLCIETYQEQDVLVYDGCRQVVPTHKRSAILTLLHAGHSGIAKTYRTAIQLYYWPSMKKDIEQSVANCSSCQAQTETRYSNTARRCETANATHSLRSVLSYRKTMARPGRQILRIRVGGLAAQIGYEGDHSAPRAVVQ